MTHGRCGGKEDVMEIRTHGGCGGGGGVRTHGGCERGKDSWRVWWR